jgi:RND family efflux transporter MFP subunit
MVSSYQTIGPVGRRKRFFLFLTSMALFGFSLIFLCSCFYHNETDEGPTPVSIVVGAPSRIQDVQSVPVSGSVASPYAPSNVAFLVSGTVLQALPREGEYVKKGQLLASIDPTDYQLALNASAAKVEQARVAFLRAEDEHGRMKFLYESESLAANDFQKFKAAFDGTRHQVEEAIAGERLSRKHLSDATLNAPIDGFITRRSIEPGEMASPGRPVFEIACVDPVEINVGVPETDIHLVRIGQKVSLTAPALPNHFFEGTVRIINVSADPGTRTYMTRITVPNPKHVLRIGMVAEAKIVGDRKISMMTLPGEAIVRDDQGATMVFVYFPEQQRAYRKRVKIGAFRGTEVEIKEGLSGDESIVIAGQDHLRDGMPVTIATPPSEDASDKKRKVAQ